MRRTPSGGTTRSANPVSVLCSRTNRTHLLLLGLSLSHCSATRIFAAPRPLAVRAVLRQGGVVDHSSREYQLGVFHEQRSTPNGTISPVCRVWPPAPRVRNEPRPWPSS